MLARLLKAVFNLLCGASSETEPAPPPPQQHQQNQQWQRPDSSKPPHVPQKPHRPQDQQPHAAIPYNKDQNLLNQQDPHYVSLRSQANEAGDAMARSFADSHQAYARGNGLLAKELSNKGKEHQQRMDALNKQASQWIFIQNNKDSKPHEIDLHGLYVKEAVTYTDRALQQARARGDKEIHLIVGKGLHSKNGAAKLKPAIEELMQKYQLSAQLDPSNTGVLIAQLDSPRNRGIGTEELTHRLERDSDACIIM